MIVICIIFKTKNLHSLREKQKYVRLIGSNLQKAFTHTKAGMNYQLKCGIFHCSTSQCGWEMAVQVDSNTDTDTFASSVLQGSGALKKTVPPGRWILRGPANQQEVYKTPNHWTRKVTSTTHKRDRKKKEAKDISIFTAQRKVASLVKIPHSKNDFCFITPERTRESSARMSFLHFRLSGCSVMEIFTQWVHEQKPRIRTCGSFRISTATAKLSKRVFCARIAAEKKKKPTQKNM